MKHRLDKAKVEAALKKRGWQRGQYGGWEQPINTNEKQAEKDWTESILEGVICDAEQASKL